MKNPLRSMAAACESKPYAVIATIILISIVLGSGIPLIEQDVDMQSFLPEDNEALVATLVLSDVFGSQVYETILVKGDITSLDGILAMIELQSSISEEPELEDYVGSVTTYMDYLFMAGLLPEVLDEGAATIIEQILAADGASESPQFVGRIVSEDLKSTLISVQVAGSARDASALENTEILMEIVRNFSQEDNGLTAGIYGDNSMSVEMMDAMGHDNQLLGSAAVLFILVVLFLIFRNLSDTLFPYLTIAVAMIWILGIMGYIGIPFTMMLVALVPLLLGICINYAIHIMFRYREERRSGKDVYEGILACVANTGTAVFVSALTTMIGFSSFFVSELVPMQHFGLLAILGIVFAFILVVTLLPALTTIRDRKRKDDPRRFTVLGGGVSLFMERIVKLTLQHKRPLFAFVVLITGLSLALSTQIGTAINWNDMAPDDIETTKVSLEIAELFENPMANRIFILVEGDIYSPDAMAEILALENNIRTIGILNSEGQPIISSTRSVGSYLDILIEANGGALPESSEAAKSLAMQLATNPQTQALIGQYLVFNPLSKYYNELTIINVDTNVLSDKDIENIVSEIEGFYVDGGDVSYRSAGSLVIMSDIMGGMMDTQIKTTIAAMVLCFLAVALIMRSPLYGFLAILTVGLSISWEFLLLYVMGWQFDLFTIMISSMIVGLGIDFSVHIIERFREEVADGKSTEEAIDIVVMNVGKALLTGTITTAGAFFIVCMSTMPIILRFGFLAGMVLIFSFLAAIFVLPPILAWTNDRKIKGPARAS